MDGKQSALPRNRAIQLLEKLLDLATKAQQSFRPKRPSSGDPVPEDQLDRVIDEYFKRQYAIASDLEDTWRLKLSDMDAAEGYVREFGMPPDADRLRNTFDAIHRILRQMVLSERCRQEPHLTPRMRERFGEFEEPPGDMRAYFRKRKEEVADLMEHLDDFLHQGTELLKLLGAGSRPKRRGCYPRDHLWLKWHEQQGSETFESPTAIHEKWNKMTEKDRRAVSTRCSGKVTVAVVKNGLRVARRERDSEAANKGEN